MSVKPFKIRSEIKVDSSKADKELKAWKDRQKKDAIKLDLDIKNFDKIENTLRKLHNLSNKINSDLAKQSLKLEQDRLRQESKLAQRELDQRYKSELELAKRKTKDITDIEKTNIKEMSKIEQEIYKADKKQATDLAKHKQKLEQDLVKYKEGLSRLDTSKINQDGNTKLISEYKDIANTIDKLQNQMNKGISGDSIIRTTNKIQDLKRTYEQLARQIDEVNRKSFDDKRDNKNLVNMNRDLTKLESSAEKAMVKLNSLEFKHIDTSQIKEIEGYLRRLKDISSKDLNLDLDVHIGDAINQVKDLDRALTNLNSVDKLVGDFQQIEHSIRDAFGDGVVNQLKNDLRQLEGMAANLDGSFDRAFNSMNAGMREVSSGINRMHNDVDQIGVSVGKFDRMFEFAIGDMAGDLLYDSLYNVVGAIGDLDTAITNVKKVADSSDINSAMKLDELKNNATDVARDVGMSVSEVMEATASSIQAGVADSIQGSLQVAEQTMKLANVGEMTQGDASAAVNSMINGFKLNPLKQVQVEMDGTIRKTNELELAMDMLNFVGNNYAVSTSDITEALKRGGSVLSTYGVSLGDTIGMMTAANEIMQDPSKVGNAMKTIGMRLSGVTFKMKDGKTVLNDTGKALKDIAGIDVFEDEQQTQVKDMVTILDELNEKYDGLSEKDQLALGEKISGKNNAATFQSLMSNWDKFKQIQDEFSKGDHFGSMEKENEQYIDSISGKLNELGAIWTDVFSDIFTQDFIKGGLDGLIAISDVIRDLVSVTSELGITFPVLIGAFGGLGNAFKGIGKESKGFKQVQQGLSKMGIDAGDTALMMGNLDSSNKKVAKSAKDVNTSTKGTSKVMNTIKSGVDKVGNSVLNAGTHLKNFAVGFGKMALVTLAVQGVAKAFDYATSAVKDHNKEIRNNIEDLQTSIKAEEDKIKYIDGTKDRYSELLKKQEEYSKSGKELTQDQASEMKELQDITQTLAEMFPELVIGYDENNGAILMSQDMDVLKQKAQETIDFQEKLIENQRKLLSESATDMMQDGEMFTYGTKNKLTINSEEYKGAIDNWRSGVLGGFKEVSQYEDNFLNSSGKKKMKHLEQYKKMTQDQQKDIDKYYTKALEATNEYYQYASQIQQAAFDQISNMDAYKGLKGENLNTANQFISSIDWGELDTAGQQKWIGATEKVLGLIQSGDPKIQKWSDSWNKANSEFKNTGDYEKYTKNLNGLAKELSTLTGVDYSTIMQGLTQVYTPLSQSEQEMQNFLSTYNKTRDDLLNGDPIAQALAKQFEGLDSLWDDLLTNDNAYTVDGKLTYNMMVEIGNRKDIPKEISDLAKSFASDNNITEQETKIITDLVFTLKEGNTDEARKKLDEINKELAKHGRDPIPMEVLTDVKGGEKIEDLNKKIEDLPKDTKTLVENEVIGEEDLETLKGLLNDSSLSDDKVVKVLMDNQDAITKAGGLKQWLDDIPPETWAKLGVKQENVEEAKQNLEEVSEKQDEVNSKESTIKVNGEETQGAIDDINSLIEHSSKLEDGIYKIDFQTNVGDTVEKLNSVKNAVNDISNAFGNIPNKTISVETAQASKNITGLRNNIQQFNSLAGGVKTVKFNTDTATASKNVTGLRSNVSSYISSYCGKSYSTKFNTQTAQASKNVTGLRSNVSSYVSSYGGKSYTTTFNVVTKYSTQGSPTPASKGAKPKSYRLRTFNMLKSEPQPLIRSIEPTKSSIQPMMRNSEPSVYAESSQVQNNFSNVGSLAATPRLNPSTVLSGVANNVNLLTDLEGELKKVNNQLDILDKKAKNAFGNEKIEYLRQQNVLYKQQQELQHQIANNLKIQQNELRFELGQRGYGFKQDGSIIEYQKAILELEKELQNLRNADSENKNDSKIKSLETTKKYLEEYMDITLDKLPKASDEWWRLQNSINDNIESLKDLNQQLKYFDEEVSIDKYNNELGSINKELDILESKLDNLHGGAKIDGLNQQIDLLKRQQNELHNLANSYRNVQSQLKGYLETQGFIFDQYGKVSNYDNLNSFASSKDLEDVKKALEEYVKLTNDEIPKLSAEWWEVESSIKDVQNSLEKLNHELSLSRFTHSLEEIGHAIDRVNDKMDLMEELYENVYGKDKLDYYDKKISLMEEEKKLLESQYNEYLNIYNVLRNNLSQYGVEFDASDLITNYDEILNKYTGSEDYEKIKDYLDEYIKLTREDITDTWKEWLELDNKIKEAQKEQLEITKSTQDRIMNIYKKQVEERKKLIKEELDEELDAINKKKEAYNDARDEAKYEDEYEKQAEKIKKLQEEYNSISGDNSLGNKKRLEELLEKIKEEQDKLDDLVQDKIDKDVNDMFDKESDRLQDEADKDIKDLEDKYSDENLQEIVDKVLSTGVFEDIDGKLHSIQDVMLEYIDKYEDGLLATGELIKSEWITNLEMARDIIKDINTINSNIGVDKYSKGRMVLNEGTSNRNVAPIELHGNLINIEGSVDSNVMDDLERYEDRIVKKITSKFREKINGR